MTVKLYLQIGIGVAVALILIGSLVGPQIIDMMNDLRSRVHPSADWVAKIVAEPIKLVMANPIAGGIIGGIVWPVVALYVFLLLFLFVLASLQGGYGSLQDTGVLE